MTLMLENQNSISAKLRADSALMEKMTTPNTRHHTQIGTAGNHRRIKIPADVSSSPTVLAQLNAYIHPIVKPVDGPRNFAAYA